MLNTEAQSLAIQCSRCGQIRSMRPGAAYTHTVEQDIEDVGFYLERFVLRLVACPVCQSVYLAVEDEAQQRRVWQVPLNAEPGPLSVMHEQDESRSR